VAWDIEDTICAIATGNAGASRGVVRITGPNTIDLLDRNSRLFELEADAGSLKRLKRASRFSGVVHLGGYLRSVPCDYWIWPTSRSYTGQPSVEIHVLGSRPILEAVIAKLITCGAKMAAPGEFTLRSFLAGRIDLPKCEAVLGVIHAQSQKGLDVALKQLAGGVAIPIAEARKTLIELLADIEAGLDFVDEDISFVTKQQILDRLADSRRSVGDLLGQLQKRGTGGLSPRIVFAGKPNAGKSSLINAIVENRVAIVSDQPGTTRDTVTAEFESKNGTLQLFDTAGLEQIFDNSPRHLAQAMTTQALQEADLVLFCIDAGENAKSTEQQVEHACRLASESEVWIVWTKADRVHGKIPGTTIGLKSCVTSDRDENLLAALGSELAQWHADRCDESAGVLPMTANRCRASLMLCVEAIDHAIDLTQNEVGDELIAAELRLALDQLGQVAGEVYTDDILDALFSRFCIGK
jgi:tRNA modification GTPase